MSPIAGTIERGLQGFSGLTDEEITKSELKNASKLAAAALAIPGINQAWSTGEHLFEVLEEGEDLTFRQLLFGPERD
jgi:hypothetical protein